MKRLICFWMMILLLPLPVSAKGTCEVCSSLGELGFPEEYRESLCGLLIKHPNWRFEPLLVTELSREKGEEYSFSHVVASETLAGRSLVSSAEEYADYRDGEALFDTGYFDATRDAVAYFLDSRNFLSEKGVFQYLKITSDDGTAEGLRRLLEGSAAASVENIATLLISVGEKTGLSPFFLASRLRQEQGAYGSPLLWGTAGATLSRWYEEKTETENGRWIAAPQEGYDAKELSALDGIYNPFHASASGQGAFAVYFSAASHGKEKGWDSLEKGLLGGAEKIQKEYVAAYQDTPFLQKWNVDIRSATPEGKSRNFWGQYMQNIGAAKTEGDRLYEAYKSAELLESNFVFSIPVFEGMGEENPDPGGGACLVFAAAEKETSSHRYSVETEALVSTVGPTRKEEETKAEKNVVWKTGRFFLLGAVFALPLLFPLRKKCQKWRNLRHFHQKK